MNGMAINSMHTVLLFEVTGDNILDKNVQVTNKMRIARVFKQNLLICLQGTVLYGRSDHTPKAVERFVSFILSLALDYIKVDDVLYH